MEGAHCALTTKSRCIMRRFNVIEFMTTIDSAPGRSWLIEIQWFVILLAIPLRTVRRVCRPGSSSVAHDFIENSDFSGDSDQWRAWSPVFSVPCPDFCMFKQN